MVINMQLSAIEVTELLSALQSNIRMLEFVLSNTAYPAQIEHYSIEISHKKILHEKIQNFLSADTLCPLKSNVKDGINEDEKISR